MSEQVIKQVIVALFPTVEGAEQGRQLLDAEKKSITLVNTAVIHKTAEGQAHVKENTGLSAKLHGADFPNDQLAALGESLPAGTSALVATIDIKTLTDVEVQLKAAGASKVSDEMGDDIMAQVVAKALAERHMHDKLEKIDVSSQAVLGVSGPVRLKPAQATELQGSVTPGDSSE